MVREPLSALPEEALGTAASPLLDTVVQQSLPQPGQVVLGTLRAIPANGTGHVHIPALGDVHQLQSLVPLAPEHVGCGVALSLLGPGSALVLGVLWDGQAGPKVNQPAAGADLRIDGEHHVIEAQQSIELRCGEAAILLTADGRIQLRGTYINSHASATQRILGGSVHVN